MLCLQPQVQCLEMSLFSCWVPRAVTFLVPPSEFLLYCHISSSMTVALSQFHLHICYTVRFPASILLHCHISSLASAILSHFQARFCYTVTFPAQLLVHCHTSGCREYDPDACNMTVATVNYTECDCQGPDLTFVLLMKPGIIRVRLKQEVHTGHFLFVYDTHGCLVPACCYLMLFPIDIDRAH